MTFSRRSSDVLVLHKYLLSAMLMYTLMDVKCNTHIIAVVFVVELVVHLLHLVVVFESLSGEVIDSSWDDLYRNISIVATTRK